MTQRVYPDPQVREPQATPVEQTLEAKDVRPVLEEIQDSPPTHRTNWVDAICVSFCPCFLR